MELALLAGEEAAARIERAASGYSHSVFAV